MAAGWQVPGEAGSPTCARQVLRKMVAGSSSSTQKRALALLESTAP